MRILSQLISIWKQWLWFFSEKISCSSIKWWLKKHHRKDHFMPRFHPGKTIKLMTILWWLLRQLTRPGLLRNWRPPFPPLPYLHCPSPSSGPVHHLRTRGMKKLQILLLTNRCSAHRRLQQFPHLGLLSLRHLPHFLPIIFVSAFLLFLPLCSSTLIQLRIHIFTMPFQQFQCPFYPKLRLFWKLWACSAGKSHPLKVWKIKKPGFCIPWKTN